MKGKYITPKIGEIYRNRNGADYRCVGFDHESAILENVETGWTLVAHGVQQYEDGTIEWNISGKGHFAGQRPVEPWGCRT